MQKNSHDTFHLQWGDLSTSSASQTRLWNHKHPMLKVTCDKCFRYGIITLGYELWRYTVRRVCFWEWDKTWDWPNQSACWSLKRSKIYATLNNKLTSFAEFDAINWHNMNEINEMVQPLIIKFSIVYNCMF